MMSCCPRTYHKDFPTSDQQPPLGLFYKHGNDGFLFSCIDENLTFWIQGAVSLMS